MTIKMEELKISERFDLEDIRKIRTYNASRYEHMTPSEIVADTKAGAANLLRFMKNQKRMKL